MSVTVDKVIEQLVAGGVVDPSKLRGCTEGEITALEKRFAVRLPRAYREFLARMGSCAASFMRGTDIECADLPQLRKYADDLLRRCAPSLVLDPADFVFAMNQGYTFLFFRCGISDDPPVFLYVEDRTSFERVAESFSSWLESAAQDEIEAEADLHS